MDRVINLERGRGVHARLKLILTTAGTCVRTQELHQGDKLRWIYTSEAFPIATVPEDDEDVRCGPILIRSAGVMVDVYLDGRELGRCSVLTLGMLLQEMEVQRRRIVDPLPEPDGM